MKKFGEVSCKYDGKIDEYAKLVLHSDNNSKIFNDEEFTFENWCDENFYIELYVNGKLFKKFNNKNKKWNHYALIRRKKEE